ncbi:MAG TPA: hypothetical protein VF518_14370, partial [Polyangia bacterium]
MAIFFCPFVQLRAGFPNPPAMVWANSNFSCYRSRAAHDPCDEELVLFSGDIVDVDVEIAR